MGLNQLFTIGYSTLALDEFVAALRHNNIDAIADIRSQPFSRRQPEFNSEPLKAHLRTAGIEYVFLGEQLGARRIEPECYEEGQAKYDLIAKTPAFQNGLNRIRRGLESRRIALMCAEKEPLTCHRMILVCRYLKEECEMFHILDSERVEPHAETELRLLDLVGLHSKNLFWTTDELLPEAYDLQSEKIAYRAEQLATVAGVDDE